MTIASYFDRVLILLKELFSNTLPVFVAASISRASSSLIALTSNDLSTLIAVQFLYAFCVVQFIGILIASTFDHKGVCFDYYMHVITECTGFAWKEFVVLVMLKWLFVIKNPGYAIGAWILIVICAFAGVYIFNCILALYVNPPAHIYAKLRSFNTDAFALAIAFSFTLAIAAEFYPTDSSSSLAGTDDVVEEPNDALKDSNAGWGFIFYAIGITIIVSIVQWKVGWIVTSLEEDCNETLACDMRGSYSVSFNSRLKLENQPQSGDLNTDENDEITMVFDNIDTSCDRNWTSTDSLDPENGVPNLNITPPMKAKPPINIDVVADSHNIGVIQAKYSSPTSDAKAFSSTEMYVD